jgi:hypothetical protein
LSVPTELNSSYWNHTGGEGARQEDLKKSKGKAKRKGKKKKKAAVVISCSVFCCYRSCKNPFLDSQPGDKSVPIAWYKIRLFLVFSFFFPYPLDLLMGYQVAVHSRDQLVIIVHSPFCAVKCSSCNPNTDLIVQQVILMVRALCGPCRMALLPGLFSTSQYGHGEAND